MVESGRIFLLPYIDIDAWVIWYYLSRYDHEMKTKQLTYIYQVMLFELIIVYKYLSIQLFCLGHLVTMYGSET